MKTRATTLRLPALLIATVLTALVGCSERAPVTPTAPEVTPPSTNSLSSTAGEAWEATKDTAGAAYDQVKDATTDTISRLDRATYEDRASIRASLADASAELEAEFAEWRSEGKMIDEKASTKLATANTEFKESLQDMGTATASGWNEAKTRTAAAWADLKAAYASAKGEAATVY